MSIFSVDHEIAPPNPGAICCICQLNSVPALKLIINECEFTLYVCINCMVKSIDKIISNPRP